MSWDALEALGAEYDRLMVLAETADSVRAGLLTAEATGVSKAIDIVKQHRRETYVPSWALWLA